MAENVKQKVKGVKKGFHDVEAPTTAVKISLYGGLPEEFDGKIVRLDLTKNLRGRSLELKMKIKYEDGKLKAYPIAANLAGSFIRRSMRRGTDYVEDSFQTGCRDALIVVKPFLITRRRVSRAVRKMLREQAKKYIESYVKIRTANELFSDIMANKLQRGMSLKLKKTYPLAMCEIRILEIAGDKPLEEIGEEEKQKLIEENKVLESESVRSIEDSFEEAKADAKEKPQKDSGVEERKVKRTAKAKK